MPPGHGTWVSVIFKISQVIPEHGPADRPAWLYPGYFLLFSVNSGVWFSLPQALDNEVALCLSTAHWGMFWRPEESGLASECL